MVKKKEIKRNKKGEREGGGKVERTGRGEKIVYLFCPSDESWRREKKDRREQRAEVRERQVGLLPLTPPSHRASHPTHPIP